MLFFRYTKLQPCILALFVDTSEDIWLVQKISNQQSKIEKPKPQNMQSAKESGSNVAASAKAGMEKTKATLQEKAEKMTTRDPLQKDMATEKKEARIHEAERQKEEARLHNTASKHAGGATGGALGQDYTTGGGGGGTF